MPFAGVGVEIIEIARMEQILARTPAFSKKVFTSEEHVDCKQSSRPSAAYAARLAARGAVLKALDSEGTLAARPDDVSVVYDAHGRPQAQLKGKVAELAQAQGVQEVAISLSFNRENAIANAVAVTPESRPVAKQANDAKEDLMRSFRDARGILDELEAATKQA